MLRIISVVCLMIIGLLIVNTPLHAQSIVTHFLDEKPYDENSYGMEMLAFFEPASGELHYRFATHQSFLYINQETAPPSNFRLREIIFYIRTTKEIDVILRVFKPNATAHVRCNWTIRASTEWVRLRCLWREAADHIYVTILAPKDTEIDYVTIEALENNLVYLPSIQNPIAAAQ